MTNWGRISACCASVMGTARSDTRTLVRARAVPARQDSRERRRQAGKRDALGGRIHAIFGGQSGAKDARTARPWKRLPELITGSASRLLTCLAGSWILRSPGRAVCMRRTLATVWESGAADNSDEKRLAHATDCASSFIDKMNRMNRRCCEP